MKAQRKIAFVLAASNHGSMIVDRFDRHYVAGGLIGVGGNILETGTFDPDEIELVLRLVRCRRRHFGDGVIVVDCGANIGVHTIECAIEMTGWGSVLAIEAQERLFYALAGNIALNNCFNARAINAAVADEDGTMRVPVPDYLKPGSFGSLELRSRPENEFIGQSIDYSHSAMQEVRTVSLDSLVFDRIDLLKIDVEGMEAEALAGAAQSIAKYHPIILVEWIKSPREQLQRVLRDHGYRVFEFGVNLVAIHETDGTLGDIKQGEGGGNVTVPHTDDTGAGS